MIPGTLLGIVALAACLVPGFLFVRVAERNDARIGRSALLEAAELTAVGAATTLVSSMIVLGLCQWIEIYDAERLATETRVYVVAHPFAILGPVTAVFLLSCGLASLAACTLFRSEPESFDPAGSGWGRVMFDDRPSKDHVVVLSVELNDGSRLAGLVKTFGMGDDPDRELSLVAPIAVQESDETRLREIDAEFVVVRERDIKRVTGKYLEGAPSASKSSRSPNRLGRRRDKADAANQLADER